MLANAPMVIFRPGVQASPNPDPTPTRNPSSFHQGKGKGQRQMIGFFPGSCATAPWHRKGAGEDRAKGGAFGGKGGGDHPLVESDVEGNSSRG